MRHLSNEVPFERPSFITKIFDYLTRILPRRVLSIKYVDLSIFLYSVGRRRVICQENKRNKIICRLGRTTSVMMMMDDGFGVATKAHRFLSSL